MNETKQNDQDDQVPIEKLGEDIERLGVRVLTLVRKNGFSKKLKEKAAVLLDGKQGSQGSQES